MDIFGVPISPPDTTTFLPVASDLWGKEQQVLFLFHPESRGETGDVKRENNYGLLLI